MKRAERRRLQRADRKHHQRDDTCPNVGTMVAWCATEADLPDTRQQLHDGLIRLMGDRRRGPVSWHWWSGDAARKVTSELHKPGDPEELSNYYRRIGALLREHGGFVVMASAEGEMR